MEPAFRFSRIDLSDGAIEGGILDDWSVGFNWYPTYHTKFMLNGILARIRSAEPVGIVQMRLQVAF
jgi:phosphate-selective porin OprO/OprP